MSTDFGLFVLKFNEMALILLRAPVIFISFKFRFQVSIAQQGIKIQSTSLTEMTLFFRHQMFNVL